MTKSDVIVIGGGVAGLSCAIYTSKAGASTVVLDAGASQIKKVNALHNVPGLPKGLSGDDWIANATHQAKESGAEIRTLHVTDLNLDESPYKVIAKDPDADGRQLVFEADYIVLAVNLGYQLLEKAGITIEINEFVPSKKIRRVEGVGFDGKTKVPGVFVAGLLSDIPSQTSVSSGQGTYVGVQIASELLGRAYMWHDR